MRTCTPIAPAGARRPNARRLDPVVAALWLASISSVTLICPAALATEEVQARPEARDRNGNGVPDMYELVPYTGFSVLRGQPPRDLMVSVFPQPVLPGRTLTVAVLGVGANRVQRMRVEPDIGAPLMIDTPAATNGLTLVSFQIPKQVGGDSVRVTVWLANVALTRTVAMSDDPESGGRTYVEELPEAVGKVAPGYPPEARRAGVSGTVLVMALVGTDGLVKDTRIKKSVPGLDEAAEACVRQWRFKPARAHGGPVAVWVAVPVRFSLH